MKILTIEQMRQVEQECARVGLPAEILMENAGRAVADEVRQRLDMIYQQNILLLIGPGNNGGDGLVAARHFHDWGAGVIVYLLGNRPENDPNLELIKQRDIICLEAARDQKLSEFDRLLSSSTALIDALFGTGKSRPLGDVFASVLGRISKAKEKNPALSIFAIDLPSGLNADSGEVDPACLYADYTITLGFPKPGLFNSHGAERAGKISVADIGIPENQVETIENELMTDDWARLVLPERPLLANKGTFGKVLVVAGSINYIGAAYLACMGALRAGAGLVTLATAASLQPVLASKLTETTYIPLPETGSGIISPEAARVLHHELGLYDVLLIGCGLGQSEPTVEFIKSTLFGLEKASIRLVLDADALNTLAKVPDWWQQLPDDAILTPHPGEMSRLVGIPVNEVQSDRVNITREAARKWHKTVVLKGAYTVIATPDGQYKISPIANPSLASGGTGDVLSGVIAGLAGQGLTHFNAAACGVYLHGKAGEVVRYRLGDAGTIATDLLPVFPVVINQLKEDLAG